MSKTPPSASIHPVRPSISSRTTASVSFDLVILLPLSVLLLPAAVRRYHCCDPGHSSRSNPGLSTRPSPYDRQSEDTILAGHDEGLQGGEGLGLGRDKLAVLCEMRGQPHHRQETMPTQKIVEVVESSCVRWVAGAAKFLRQCFFHKGHKRHGPKSTRRSNSPHSCFGD